MENLESFDSWLNSENTSVIEKSIPNNIDGYGKEHGLTRKSSHKPLALPDKPFGDIVTSAYANVNVPTRTISGTSSKDKPNSGNLGCAAAVSLIFFRATGYPLVRNKKLELSTGTMWDFLIKSPKWKIRPNWKSDSQPGDIIITRRGSSAGHVGVVVDDNKIISNSSGGFKGDKKGQIELNYTLDGWKSVARRNPTKTASFEYIGKYRTEWDGPDAEPNEIDAGGSGDSRSGSGDSRSDSGDSSGSASKSVNSKRKRSRYYYKVYDKDNRRFLTAKYKGDMFKVYNRKKKKVGEVFLKEGAIIMDGKDISQTEVGIVFKKLFKIAAKGQVISNNGKDYIEIDRKVKKGGKVKHNYSGEKARNISLIEEEAIKQGVVNPNSIIAILSVIGKETHFIPKNEHSYSGTTAQRLKDVIFKETLKHLSYDEVDVLKMDNVAFYDTVYGYIANDNGYHKWNAPAAPGDGYKWRGRGFNQLTFKKSYKKMADLIGMQSIMSNPDSLNDPKVAAEVAVKFLLKRLAQKSIDPNEFDTPRAAILKYAAANAGWGRDPSTQIAHSNEIEPNFSIA